MNERKGKSGMTPTEIRNALYEANLNQAAIARELSVCPSHISTVIDGKGTSRRVHAAIAEAIGVDIRKIWPDRYLIQGEESRRGRPAKIWNRKTA